MSGINDFLFGDDEQTTTTTQDLTDEQMAAQGQGVDFNQQLLDFFDATSALFGLDFSDGSLTDFDSQIAGFNDDQLAAFDMTRRNVEGLDEAMLIMADAINFGLYDVLDMNNPILTDAINAAIDPVTAEFTNQVLPMLGSASIEAGAFGGSGHALAQSEASRLFNNEINNLSAALTNDFYQAGLDTFNNTLALAPDIYQTMATLGPSMLLDIGNQQQELESAQLSEATDLATQFAELLQLSPDISDALNIAAPDSTQIIQNDEGFVQDLSNTVSMLEEIPGVTEALGGAWDWLFGESDDGTISETGAGGVVDAAASIGTGMIEEILGAPFPGGFELPGGMGATVGDVLTNVGYGVAGGWLGSELGKSIFDDGNTTGWGGTVGGTIGSYWGPWGSAAGAFIGELADAAFATGENKNMTSGFATTMPGDDLVGEVELASGLTLYGIDRDADPEGTEAFMDLAQGIDAQFVNAAAALGIEIDISNDGFGGEVQGDGKNLNENPTFFGSHQRASAEGDKVAGQLEDGMADFVSAWFTAAADQYPPEIADDIAALAGSGTADEMIQAHDEILIAALILQDAGLLTV